MAVVSEITSGTQFSRTLNENQIADAQTRVFRVIRENISEYVDIPGVCGIRIGQPHPQNAGLTCTSFDGRPDGDSRMVLICTFQYASAAPSSDGSQSQPKQQAPNIRAANWSVSSTTYEAPAYRWNAITGPDREKGWIAPTNPVGDRYDGVTKMEPLVTFSIEQYESSDPTRHVKYAGVVNRSTFSIGEFEAPPRTLMFKGVQSQPVVEPWGEDFYRGWKATYEFVYRRNYAGPDIGSIGWDIAVPQTGFNVKAFVPPGGGDDDPYGQPLSHDNGKIRVPLLLPSQIFANEKVRAMVKVFEYDNGGASQLPSAQPIPLNDSGRPRKDTADPKVHVYRYQVQEDHDFSTFNIRLY